MGGSSTVVPVFETCVGSGGPVVLGSMRNRRTGVRGIIAGALTAVAIAKVGCAFIAPPAPQTGHRQSAVVVAPILAAGAAAWVPQAATAAELRDNGFGIAEIAAIVIPWIFVFFSYFEWESMQPPTDNVTGVAVLGDVVDGPPDDQRYFKRSPETG